jgi:predicted XRE-type DNA-binding protein
MRNEFKSVWDAIEDTPEESQNMKLRSKLLMAISAQVEKMEGSQTEKASQLGLTQPRLNDLLRGKINRFSLDALVNIATCTGLNVTIEAQVA